MDKEIQDLLTKLNIKTGLHLEISEQNVDDDTSLRLQELLLSVKDHAGRDLFWQNLLLGQLSREETVLLSRRFHIDMSARRVLFLVAFLDTVSDVTRSMLKTITTGRDEVLSLDERHIAIIKIPGDSDMDTWAYSLSDMISSEAMVSSMIAYDDPVEDINMLPDSYKNCEAALRLAGLLHADKKVVSCDRLAFEKLLYSVGQEDALDFLRRTVTGIDMSAIDNEMKNTITTLFENELNIADTAKALFIHRNTLVYRLEKFQKQTGLDLKKFDDAVICKTAFVLSELHGK